MKIAEAALGHVVPGVEGDYRRRDALALPGDQALVDVHAPLAGVPRDHAAKLGRTDDHQVAERPLEGLEIVLRGFPSCDAGPRAHARTTRRPRSALPPDPTKPRGFTMERMGLAPLRRARRARRGAGSGGPGAHLQPGRS